MNTVLITGATDGIGKQTATELAARGFRVLVHGRSAASAAKACEDIRTIVMAANLEPVHADLASLKEVRRLADDVRQIAASLKVLVNNAGVYMNSYERSMDGFEMTFAVNHLAHFLLTNLLCDLLRASGNARVIHVSSIAHTRGAFDLDTINEPSAFSPYRAYAASKLANVLFSNALARRVQRDGIVSNSLHPGVITTKLLKAGFSMSGAAVARGAETPVFLATSPLVEGITGRYFTDAREASSSSLSRDEALQERLWERSTEWTRL